MRNVAGAPRKGDLAARKLLVEGWNNCRCAWLPCQISLTLETDQAAASEPPHCTYKVNTAVCWLSPISDSSLSLPSLLPPPPSSLLWPLSHVLTYVQLDTITYIHALGVCCNVAVSRYLWFLYPPSYRRKEYSCIEFTFSGYTIIYGNSLPIRNSETKFYVKRLIELFIRVYINPIHIDRITHTRSDYYFSKNKCLLWEKVFWYSRKNTDVPFFFFFF